jgi:hypothetical protein
VKSGGSPDIEVVAHIPLDGYFSSAGVDVEQDLTRPYAYVGRMMEWAGFTIISLADPQHAHVIYDWRIPDAARHIGYGGENGRYFRLGTRSYYILTFNFRKESPLDADLSAIVFDVTNLPDTSTVREVARVHGGRMSDVFPYKHSDGRTLLFMSRVDALYAEVIDAAKLVSGDKNEGRIGKVPIPETNLKHVTDGYHELYVAYDPVRHQDKFYGGGLSTGFHVFDVTKPETPRFLFSVAEGENWYGEGHTITATPDGRYAIVNTEQPYSPLMFFDLADGIAGKTTVVDRPIGAWTADWHDTNHSMDVRWPYLFVAAYEDGLQVVNIVDPTRPTTIGWYYTCNCAHGTGWDGYDERHGRSVRTGAADVRVRNADGLIVVDDYTSGFWAFRLRGFNG